MTDDFLEGLSIETLVGIPVDVTDAPKIVQFPSPWYPIETDGTLESQLVLEVGNEHVLYGRNLRAVARKKNSKADVIYSFNDHPSAYAEVHLTWSKKPSTSPAWPVTFVFDSFEEWIEERVGLTNTDKESEGSVFSKFANVFSGFGKKKD